MVDFEEEWTAKGADFRRINEYMHRKQAELAQRDRYLAWEFQRQREEARQRVQAREETDGFLRGDWTGSDG